MQEICSFSFSEIQIGLKKSFSKKITDEDMRLFLKISGDVNPLHNDDSYAKTMKHQGRVVYGMLTASMLSKLAGVYLPGLNSLILSVNIDFVKPAYVGDTLTISGEVTEKKEFGNLIKLTFAVSNQNSERISRGHMFVKVTK